MENLVSKIRFRQDTQMNWETANPILAEGEPGFDIDSGTLKIGHANKS